MCKRYKGGGWELAIGRGVQSLKRRGASLSNSFHNFQKWKNSPSTLS